MKPEEIEDLDRKIWLIVKTNQNQTARIEVPKKIRLMCRMIDDLLQEDESQKEIHLYIGFANLELIVNYCAAFDFLKLKSTIPFPASYPDFERNVSPTDFRFFGNFANDYDKLYILFCNSKYLKCEPLYQLCALAIACWFKLNNQFEEVIEKFAKKTSMNQGFKTDSEMQKDFPYIYDEQQRKQCEL